MADVRLEWIHPISGGMSGPPKETCRAFLAILEDVVRQVRRRGIEVEILESTDAAPGSPGRILLNGIPFEQFVPVHSVRGSSESGACPGGGGPCGGAGREQDIPCEEYPESVIRLAIVKAASRR